MKKDKELLGKEKKQMHDLLVRTYPKRFFIKLYNKHGYYSTVKPQMNFLIKKDNKLVGTGKFLWRNVEIDSETIKLFAFGMVVAKEYQNKGLGTKIIRLSIKNAKIKEGDIVYASTSRQKVKKMLIKLGFTMLKIPVFYKDVITKKIKRNSTSAYIFEFKKGLTKKINSLPKIYIGLGPI